MNKQYLKGVQKAYLTSVGNPNLFDNVGDPNSNPF